MTTGARKSLETFDQELAARNLHGQWKVETLLAALTDGQPAGAPFLWPWGLVYDALREACEVLPESFRARRDISFVNPGLARRGTTQTIVAGVQLVLPGEVAWAHRHTIGALRFVIEGDERLYTVVDGEALPMETNDLILTPQWSWHDHHNEGAHDGIWLDVLDSPLVLGLSQTFYEPFGAEEQPRRAVPSGLHRFAWREVEPLLTARAREAPNPYDGVRLDYVHPKTRGPVLTTLSAHVQLLQPGTETQAHRHTSSAVVFVIKGGGATIFDDRSLEWSDRDTFVIPNWTRHRFVNPSREPALLFSVTDEPLLTMLGLYREES